MTIAAWPATIATLLVGDLPEFPSAACRDTDEPSDFFPPPGGGYEGAVSRAKALCESCPEQSACLLWADDHETYGIWGGKTEQERRARFRPPLTCVDCGVSWPDPGGRGPKHRRCVAHRRRG